MKPSTFSQPKTPAVDQSTAAAPNAKFNTPRSRNTQVQLLRKARVHIKAGNAVGLCRALQLAFDGMQAWRPPHRQYEISGAYLYLRDWVRSMLGHYAWYEGWLQAQGYKVHTANGDISMEVERTVHAARLRWIDWMIEQTKQAK